MFLNVFHKTYNNFPMYGNLCKGGGGGRDGEGKINLASHEYFPFYPNQHWYIRGRFVLASTVTATESEWAESVCLWFFSWQLQRKFSYWVLPPINCLFQERQAACGKTPQAVLC